MVKWTSGGSERAFNQSAANGRNEPILYMFCVAARVRFRGTDICSIAQNSWPYAYE
jgi:hypothetical protein